MHFTTDFEDAPSDLADPLVKAGFMVDLVQQEVNTNGRWGEFILPSHADYWQTSREYGYPWPDVAKGLKELKIEFAPRAPEDVPIALSVLASLSVTGTRAETATAMSDDECTAGIGALLRDPNHPWIGRDVQLACKSLECDVCGPRKRVRMRDRMMADFFGKDAFAIALDNDLVEWVTLRRSLNRAGASYHRIPWPDGSSVILTTKEVGIPVPVADRRRMIEEIVELRPCDGRRSTSSRDWQGAGDTYKSGWKREGVTTVPQPERMKIYQEEGRQPAKDGSRHEDVESAIDLVLEAPGTPEMNRLASRLDLHEPAEEAERPAGF